MTRSGSREAFAGLVTGDEPNYVSQVPYDPTRHAGGLLRLDPGAYLGRAFVHWSMTIERRSTGWLDVLHHARTRELMCHALSRYGVVCPAYCLMPDHGHFLWIGLGEMSDQKRACSLFRNGWNAELKLGARELQRQPFDHVLREHERERGTFGTVAQYVLENPVRAGLVEKWKEYRFCGAVVPGYPDMDPRDDDFWERFWRVYGKLAG